MQLARNLVVLVGGVLVTISSTPLDWWLYAALGVATCIWLPLEWCNASVPKKSLIAARLVVFAIWSVALGLEIRIKYRQRCRRLDDQRFL